ncbi:hypothetical protein N5U05_11445 [Aliarcobacter butzleri]|uniref:hypothetical protein n=1 Tax=Aliarcobacter butzleri TaxID=28197 RepID=UPI0021B29ED0|nr:hypothetical protein [Aliarcobacter butzleri]MCT7618353.1 hypothetical protein [Aliarcobacter butzleri]
MHTKDYLNQEIKEEIEKKGFSIYNYISFKELLLTVNKGYRPTKGFFFQQYLKIA